MSAPEILYEDNEIIVCYKPAGFAVQTRRLGQQDLETWLKNYRARKKEKPYIGVIHRLDQPVEGIMVFAKTPKAAASLSAQVQNRDIGKYYYAIGCPKESENQKPVETRLAEEGTRTDYIGFDSRTNTGFVSSAQEAKARPKEIKKAVLDYRIVGEKPERAEECRKICFDIHLHTGRHHQIRLQLMNAGYPLLGDVKYGGESAAQLALCSYRIAFKHPVSGKIMDYTIKPQNPAFQGFV